jgi:O-antigen ligase
VDKAISGIRTQWPVRLAAAICLAVVVIAPMAVGGFRPHWWLMFASVLFFAAALATYSLARSNRHVRFLTHGVPGLAPLYLVFLVGLCLHVLLVGGAASETDAIYGLIRQLSYAALGWTLLQALTRGQRAVDYATVLVIGFLFYAVYGLITIDRTEWLFFEKTSYLGVATGPFVNRNSFATFLAIGMSLTLASALADDTGVGRQHRSGHRASPLEGRMRSLVLATVALLCLAAIFATASRMGLFVALVGASVVVILRLRRIVGRTGLAGIVALALGVLGGLSLIMVALLYGGAVTERLGSTADSASVRIDLYLNILDMIRANPLLGVGLGNFGEAFRAYQRLPVSPDLDWHLAHNTYLALWSELGIVLGSLPILLVGLVTLALLRRSLSKIVTPVSHLSDAALAAVVIVGLHSLLDFSLEMPANAYLFVAVIVLGLAPNSSSLSRGAKG